MKLLVFAFIMALMVSMIKSDSSEERNYGFRNKHNRHRQAHLRYFQEPAYPENNYPFPANGPGGSYPPFQ